jgi:hypothetical protein
MSAHILGAIGARCRLHGRSCQLLSLGALKDWELLPVIREREFTFVTNNGADFLALLGKEPLHPWILIIVPNVTPILQRELFKAALDHIGTRDLANSVVEVKYAEDRIGRGSE